MYDIDRILEVFRLEENKDECMDIVKLDIDKILDDHYMKNQRS